MVITDISVPISEGMAVWEGDPPVHIEQIACIDKDGANVSMISFSLHTGTHIDAPLHYLHNGNSTDQLLLEKLIGDVQVVEIPDEINVIDLKQIQQFVGDCSTQRLLIKTRNSKHITETLQQFNTEFVALTPDAACELSKIDLRLVGIDAPSIARYGSESEVHHAFLEKDIVVLEGIDLSQVQPGNYKLVCLPLKIVGVDGAPVRAILLS